MLKNYIKIALRQLRKQKTFSFLNIFGLALSMSICMLIIMLIKDANSYDLFHKDADRIYRVVTNPIRKDGGSEPYASSPYMVGKTLSEDYPQVELWTPLLNSLTGTMVLPNKKIDFNGLFTDHSFFDQFGFKLKKGNVATALKEPYTIILTEKLASKLFNNENPLEKEIEIPGFANHFKVTGVLEKPLGKTHLEFEALGSLATQLAQEKITGTDNSTKEWQDYYSTYNFVRLKETTNIEATELALADIVKTKYRDLEFEVRDIGYQFTLQALSDITPGPIMSNSMGRGMPNFLIWFLTILGIIIILSACFNYTNLTVARSFVRTKEIGVRKVIGASRGQVFWQFINEAIITALFALVLGYLLFLGLKPLFLKLQFSQFTDLSMEVDLMLLVLFLLFTIVVGFAAGLLPASTLSRTSPKSVLQNLQNIKLIQWFGARKVLLVTQFVVTLVFFITVTIAWQQINYATKINFGTDQEQTLLVDMQGQNYNKLSSAFSQVSGVEKMSAISIPMGTWADASSNIRIKEEDEKIVVREYFIDENYLEHFNLKLVAGENFIQNLTQQKERFAIVNETFVQNFKLNENETTIGQSILVGDSILLTIQGVVADFLFKPSNYSIEPLLLRYDPNQLGTINLSLNTNDIPSTLTALERSWDQFDGLPFMSNFFDEKVKSNYSNARDIMWIVSFFGIISMIIACMGLLGMAIYLVKTKAKEISIRKVMGASAKDLTLLLSKKYLILFGIAVGIAVPLSYLIGSQLLQIFANRISLSILLFLPGITILFLIVSFTIGSQTLKAALANPAKNLKTD